MSHSQSKHRVHFIKYSFLELFWKHADPGHRVTVMATTNGTKMNNEPIPRLGKRLTKSELRVRIRLDAENCFMHCLLTSFVRFPLKLSPDLPLPTITFDHLQDLCNKATAIYTRQKRRQNRLHKEKIKNYIFDKWVRGNIHSTDIEFYNFLAKFISLEKKRRRFHKTS